MTFKIINYYKNIGEILEEYININHNHIIFLDWDDTVISTSALLNKRIEFRNQREKDETVNIFKKFSDSKLCLGLYILTYRENPNEVLSEATELKIMEYLKSEFVCNRTDNYRRIGPIISASCSCPKINIIEEIISKDFKNISNNVSIYFIDDNYQNIVSCLLSNKFDDKMFIYFYPESSENIKISKNINKKANEILKYLK